MADTLCTVDTVYHDQLPKLDLSSLPPVYVLATHLSINEQHEAEDALSSAGAPLTYDIKEANLVFANISRARRAKAELQWKGVRVEEISDSKEHQGSESSPDPKSSTPPAKKSKKLAREREQRSLDLNVVDFSTASETEDGTIPNTKPMSQLSLSRMPTPSTVGSTDAIEIEGSSSPPVVQGSFAGKVKVVKLEWLNDSLTALKVLPLDSYAIYEAKLLPPKVFASKAPPSNKNIGIKRSDSIFNKSLPMKKDKDLPQGTVERRSTHPKPNLNRRRKHDQIGSVACQDVLDKSFSSSTQPSIQPSKQFSTRPIHLLHQTTSEHDEANSSSIPSMPEWVIQNKIYACERATPLNPPNKEFICQLKKIKLARLLTLDEIGVRAYSTSIASLAAYPHLIQTTREILALPGCDQKIAHLFHVWHTTDGHIRAVADIEADPALSVLREFYEIWGVGAKTAREFFYDKGWRDLDDIVEHGWKSLSRVQQIGLKYYDEFLLKIPRAEVESIAATITHHAKLVTDANVETIIVGGYRRGKPESGDVDMILSHRNEAMTYNLVDRVVKSLEKEGWITHTLTLNLTNTKRNQETLPISTATQVGHRFDTLDKALVVWQDPNWPSKATDLIANPKAKNPNPHRRVDIIISPWRTVGCAIAGWTSGTTFQRDLRRYAKHTKGWKFDSSGVRERGTGRWVDLERWSNEETRCQDWQEAERRVFEGLGLVYREPWDRCTG